MTEDKAEHKEHDKTVSDEEFDEETHRSKSVWESACSACEEIENGVLSFLPVEVTNHLVESKKEFVKAMMRLGEIEINKLDEMAARAQEIHERMKAEKAAKAHTQES